MREELHETFQETEDKFEGRGVRIGAKHGLDGRLELAPLTLHSRTQAHLLTLAPTHPDTRNKDISLRMFDLVWGEGDTTVPHTWPGPRPHTGVTHVCVRMYDDLFDVGCDAVEDAFELDDVHHVHQHLVRSLRVDLLH